MAPVLKLPNLEHVIQGLQKKTAMGSDLFLARAVMWYISLAGIHPETSAFCGEASKVIFFLVKVKA